MTSTAFADASLTTAGGVVAVPQIEQPTRLSSDVIAGQAGALRSTADGLQSEVAEFHNHSLVRQLDDRATDAAKRPPADMLTELADAGFSWAAIARVVGVSVPAIRKWRQGESVAPENRKHLAMVVAFVGVVSQDHMISDVASWVEIPIADGGPSGVDVLVAGRFADLMEFAAGNLSANEVLDRVFPGWEDTIDRRFEVAADDEGGRYIRLRDDGGGQ